MTATAAYPTYTRIPDELLDQMLQAETLAEMKVMLYMARRTLGFKKDSDRISLSQFLNGITKSDGTVLDKGCGIKSKSTIVQALERLAQKAVIKVSEMRGHFQAKEYAFALAPSETGNAPSQAGNAPSVEPLDPLHSDPRSVQPLYPLGTETVPTDTSQRESIDSLGEDLNPQSKESVGTAPELPPEDDDSERTDSEGKPRLSREQIVAYIQDANLAAAERLAKGDQLGAERAREAIRKGQAMLKRFDHQPPKPFNNLEIPRQLTPAILARLIVDSGDATIAAGSKVVMPERPGLTEAQAAKAEEMRQRLAAARAKADPLALVRMEAEPDNAPEKARQTAIEARVSKYVPYLNLNRHEMLQKLYGECVVNPNPHVEAKKLMDWALQMKDFNHKQLMLVVDGFHDGKGRAITLKAIQNNLEAKGILIT